MTLRLIRELRLPRQPSVLRAHIMALLATALAFGIRLLLHPFLDERLPLTFFLFAAWLITWLCGTGPGFLSLVLGYFCEDFYFIPPVNSLFPRDPVEFFNLTIYLLFGFFGLFTITALRHWMQTSLLDKRHSSELEREVRERKAAQEAASRAREELAAVNTNLESLVKTRTKDLLQTTEDLNGFCYSVAHDLKAPLRAQASFAQMLMSQYSAPLGDRGCSMLRSIVDAAERQSRLVDDLLAHLSLSRTEQNLVPCDIHRILGEVLGDLQIHLREQRAHVDSDLVGHAKVMANPASLALILQNLITNACKFVAPGVQPRLTIRTEKQDRFLRLFIQDNGIGIPAEFHRQIFGVFQRLHNDRRYPGTGIGLAIVQRAIHRMHGAVGLESKPGEGSTFWIELPLAEMHSDNLEPEPMQESC